MVTKKKAKKKTSQRPAKKVTKRWYAVRTYFEQKAHGKAKKKDSDYKKVVIGLEERVVIFAAKSLEQAIELAKKDARKYEKRTYRNHYGETIRGVYLGRYDAVELSRAPADGKLAFGLVDIFSSKIKLNKSLEHRHIKRREKIISLHAKKFAPKSKIN